MTGPSLSRSMRPFPAMLSPCRGAPPSRKYRRRNDPEPTKKRRVQNPPQPAPGPAEMRIGFVGILALGLLSACAGTRREPVAIPAAIGTEVSAAAPGSALSDVKAV